MPDELSGSIHQVLVDQLAVVLGAAHTVPGGWVQYSPHGFAWMFLGLDYPHASGAFIERELPAEICVHRERVGLELARGLRGCLTGIAAAYLRHNQE